jgi:hypothetical protein
MTTTRWLAAAALGASAIGLAFSAAAQPRPTWTDVGPIFAQNCTMCHSGPRAPEGIDLSTYATAIAGGEDGPVLVCGDASESELYEKITGEKPPQMPLNGPPLPAELIELIANWINAGCPEA